jgi:CheY-like chemotaxis protein
MRAHERRSIEEEMAPRQSLVMETPAPVLALEASIPAQALKTPVPETPAIFRAPDMVTPPKRSKKILVADDDLPLRRVLGKILTSAGYDVILVEDGMAAVETAKAERPDLVITDALMPRLHGFLACKEIKQIESPPKVIMLTAVYTKCSYRVEATQRYGADDLLTKPFAVADLLACVEKHLADSAASASV